MPSYQWNVAIDGFALATQGAFMEAGNRGVITSVGATTDGFIVNENDFWEYAEVVINPNWVFKDL